MRATLGVLGRKWSLLVLRDVAFHERVRFSDLLRNIDDLTPRVLSFRLRELQRDGYVRKETRHGDVTYELTPKGADAIPLIVALTSLGFKHYAPEVFEDARPRELADLLVEEPREIFGAIAAYALEGRHVRVPLRIEAPSRARRPVTL
jgi:DNA-binding HxlR family transcriptional regulator